MTVSWKDRALLFGPHVFRRGDVLAHLLVVAVSLLAFHRTGIVFWSSFQASSMRGAKAWNLLTFVPYSGGEARFSTAPGVGLSAKVRLPPGRYQVQTRVWDYGQGRNLIGLSLGDQTTRIAYGGEKPSAGLLDLEWPVVLDHRQHGIGLTVEEVGQNAVLVDAISIAAERPLSWQTAGRFGLAILLAMVALQVVLATVRLVGAGTLQVEPSSGRSFAFLDGFRGLAVLVVVLLHGQGVSQIPDLEQLPLLPLGPIVRNGHVGVTIFFVLSAFTLYYGLYRTILQHHDLRTWRFLRNRVLRIFPAYLLAVVLATVLRAYLVPWAPAISRKAVVAHLGFSQIWRGEWVSHVIDHSVWWSVPTELQFYLLLPLLVLVFPRAPRCLTVLLVVLGFVFDAAAADAKAGWGQYSVFNYLDAFALGMLAAHLFTEAEGRTATRQAPRSNGYLALACFCTAIGLVFVREQVTPWPIWGGIRGADVHHVTFSVCIALTIYFALRSDGWVRNWFSSPSWCALGKLAYGIYLAHVPIYYVVQRLGAPILTSWRVVDYLMILALTLIATCVVSFVSYRFLEYPILRWGRRIPDGSRVSLAVVAGGGSVVVAGWVLAAIAPLG